MRQRNSTSRSYNVGTWRIQTTPSGNFTINGRMYPDLKGALNEIKRLNQLVRRAQLRKQPIVRDYAREQKILFGEVKGAK